MGAAILTRLTYDFFEAIGEEGAFDKQKIGAPIDLPEWSQVLVAGLGEVVVSSSMTLPCGTVNVGDVVWLRNPFRLARVRLAVRVGSRLVPYKFSIIVDVFSVDPRGSWCTHATVAVVDADSVSQLCCHFISEGRVFV